jgi:hypothetical protein
MRSDVRYEARTNVQHSANKNITIAETLPVQSCNDSAYGAQYDT